MTMVQKNRDNTKGLTLMCFHPLVHVHGVKRRFIFLATILGLKLPIWLSNFFLLFKTPYIKLIKVRCTISSYGVEYLLPLAIIFMTLIIIYF
jgi:hypothetical protein